MATTVRTAAEMGTFGDRIKFESPPGGFSCVAVDALMEKTSDEATGSVAHAGSAETEAHGNPKHFPSDLISGPFQISNDQRQTSP